MTRNRMIFAFLVLFLPAMAARADTALPASSGNATFDRTVATVLANFYAADRLGTFREAVDTAVANLPNLATDDPATVNDAISFILGSLGVSHTARYTPDGVAYYELVDVFRFGMRDTIRRLFPDGDVLYTGIGIVTRVIDGAVFVTDVYTGSPADMAGVLAGDEIIAVDDAPFQPIDSFGPKVGGTVTLSIRRAPGAAAMSIDVPVEWLQPTRTLVSAIEKSATVTERDGFRIGYLRLWSYTARDTKNVIEAALAGPLADADGLVLDLRSRWGGAPADAADSFVGGSPDMVLTFQNGDTELDHARWRKPLVAIIDEGTRSGMEILAYALKQNGVRMVGTNTAGAVLAARGYMLPDNSLLVLAVADVHVDGIRLEGVGVAPDVAVPFDVRYAGGADPQREAAVEELVGELSAGVN